MKTRYFIFLLFAAVTLFAFSKVKIVREKLFPIPAQTFDIWKAVGDTKRSDTVSVDSFQISSQITYGQYKIYLNAIKKDSSVQFYQSQLPDSDMCAHDAYVKYVNSKEFDNYPVSGISWISAMNFCKWKTIKENPKDSFSIIYRLPTFTEWVAAYNYLSEHKIVNDFNQDYSDWTLTTMDESAYDFMHHSFFGNYIYMALPNDSKVMKRKLVAGNSFHFCEPNLAGFHGVYFYETDGYSYVSFRYIKKSVKPLEMRYKNNYWWDTDNTILSYWKLIKQTYRRYE